MRKTWKVREGVLAALWAAGGGWVGGRGGWLTPETADTRLLNRAEGILFIEMTCAVIRSNARSVCFYRAQLHQYSTMCPSNESQYYGNENLVKESLTRDFRSRSSTIVSLGSGSNNVSHVPVVSRFLGKRLNLSLGLLRGQLII